MTLRDWMNMATTGRSLLAIMVLTFAGCETENSAAPVSGSNTSINVEVESLRPQITVFCGGCHAVPDPAAFPKNAWHHEVEKAYVFFHKSGCEDLTAPPLNAVVQWFRAQAPNALTIPSSRSSRSPLRFRRESIAYDSSTGNIPSISDVFFHADAGLGPTQPVRPSVVFCDMRNGHLGDMVAVNDAAFVAVRRPPALHNPAHIETADLDSNQNVDYVIFDLVSPGCDRRTSGVCPAGGPRARGRRTTGRLRRRWRSGPGCCRIRLDEVYETVLYHELARLPEHDLAHQFC